MSERASTMVARGLATQDYEQLRSEALGMSMTAQGSGGLALLMRNGMAAWMAASASCASAEQPQRRRRTPLPPTHSDVVMVLAQMTIAAALQERTR